jgi:hypothetical protein
MLFILMENILGFNIIGLFLSLKQNNKGNQMVLG